MKKLILTTITALCMLNMNLFAQFTCGTDLVQDIEGNWYNTVLLGTQCWIKENMRTTKYPDNSPITKGAVIHGDAGWGTDQAWYSCPPNNTNDGEDCTAAVSLGMVYQWSAAMNGSITEGAQGICPDGWHVPTDTEWKTLEGFLGMTVAQQDAIDGRGTNEGSKMAAHVAVQNWTAGALTGDAEFNTSGFTVVPSGCRVSGNYVFRGNYTFLWTSTGISAFAWTRNLSYLTTQIYRNEPSMSTGFSVRCLKDNPVEISEYSLNAEVSVYPNPATDKIIIENSKTTMQNYIVTIKNIQGQEMLNKNITQNTNQTIDVSKLENGIYFITIHNDKENYVRKILIQK